MAAYLLIGKADSAEEAIHIASRTAECPFTACSFANRTDINAVFVLPAGSDWWFERFTSKTVLNGLHSTRLISLPDASDYESLWSSGKALPCCLVTPCYSECPNCPEYSTRCQGCPVSLHTRQTPRRKS